MTAPTSDERREVARMLRWFASLHGNVACVTVGRTLNLDYSDGFGGGAVTSESVRRLADLIDPTCEMTDASWDNGECTWGCICSACDAHIEHEEGRFLDYCPRCGARVVSCDDE